MSRRGNTIVFLVAALAAAAFYHLRSPNIPDPDSFYHFRHAALYRTQGLCMTEFPWIAWSIIRVHAADIWYGFHLLLVPFSAIQDPGTGIKLAGILLTTFLLLSIRASLRRLQIAGAFFWPFLLLVAGPNVLLHFTMMRPHVLTMGLCALLFSSCVKGRAWGPLVISLALTFFHLSLFWMIPAIVLPVVLSLWLVERRLVWASTLAALAGLLLGAAVRPHPFGAAKIAYVQIVEHSLVRQSGVPLLVGKELLPITWDVIALNFIPFLILWMGAGALAVAVFRGRWRKGPPSAEASSRDSHGNHVIGRPSSEEPISRVGVRGFPTFEAHINVVLLSSALLSLLFFGMMLFLARRSFAPWVLFSVIFIGAVTTICTTSAGSGSRDLDRGERGLSPGPGSRRLMPWAGSKGIDGNGIWPRQVILVVGVLFAVMLVQATIRNRRNLDNAYPADACRNAAEWIAAHGRPGDIVFNVHWDSFPQLFLWNQNNRYVHGMDPIFLYAYDPVLYYEAFYIQIQKATSGTCGQAHCTADTVEDTFTVIKRDFQASWLFVEKERTPQFYAWVKSDARFVPGYENATQAVFGLR